jgi:hypothetical protein
MPSFQNEFWYEKIKSLFIKEKILLIFSKSCKKLTFLSFDELTNILSKAKKLAM